MKNVILLLFCCYSFLACAQTGAYADSIKAHRTKYKADFLKDERSPFYGKKKALKKLRFFDADESFKIECTFQRTADAEPFDMATYSGKVKSFVQYGIIHFEVEGQACQLSIYRNLGLLRMEAYANHLFLPFKDSTNDRETYGGGRYIDLEVSDIKDGKVIIDFNKCYNPWCAFSGGYNCPVPPRENHLPLAIRAGERKYKGKK
jgi:uncharacterized protein